MPPRRLSIGPSHDEATGTTKMVYEAADRFLGRTASRQRILVAHSPYLVRWFGGLVAADRRRPHNEALTDPTRLPHCQWRAKRMGSRLSALQRALITNAKPHRYGRPVTG